MKKHKISFIVMLFGIPIASLLIDTAVPYFLSQAIGTFASNDSSALWNFILLASCAAIVGISFS